MFTVVLFRMAKNWKQTRDIGLNDTSVAVWLQCGPLYHGILLNNKKRESTDTIQQSG